MSAKPRISLVRRNALLIAIAGWLIASFAAAQTRIPTATSRVSPPNVTGGATVNVAVTLSEPLMAATTVTLTSSLPAVAYPNTATVALARGSSSFNYIVSTNPVASDTTVQISARVSIVDFLGRVSNVSMPGVATVTVLAPVLLSLDLDRSSVMGGVSVSEGRIIPVYGSDGSGNSYQIGFYLQGTSALGGSVQISGPAPSGFSIALGSSDPAAVASMFPFPVGTRAARFDITTTAVATTTIAQISARLGSVVKSAPLEILIRIVPSVSPKSVEGGQSLTGSVALSGPAPAGGLAVTLGPGPHNLGASLCSPSLISVQPQLLVAAGSTSATFPISTSSAVSLNSAIIGSNSIVAGYGTQPMVQSNQFSVNPAPSRPSVNVPAQIKGGTTAVGTIKLDRPPLSESCGIYAFSLGFALPSAAASVPSRVIFPVGASEALFSITTAPVESDQSITLSVTGDFITTASVYSATPVKLPINITQPQPVTFVVTP